MMQFVNYAALYSCGCASVPSFLLLGMEKVYGLVCVLFFFCVCVCWWFVWCVCVCGLVFCGVCVCVVGGGGGGGCGVCVFVIYSLLWFNNVCE